MSLTTTADLKKLDTASGGEPFCSIPSKNSVVINGNLDTAFTGEPFYGPLFGGGGGPGGSPSQVYVIN